MNTLVIAVADDTLRNLEQQAQSVGKSSAEVVAALIEDVFGSTVNNEIANSTIREKLYATGLFEPLSGESDIPTPDRVRDAYISYDVDYSATVDTEPISRPKTAREILEEAGMIRLLGDELTSLIGDDIPSLDEVIDVLSAAGGPSLTEILDEQRGPKTWRISS